MPEGLSPGEVGKEISEHRAHAAEEEEEEKGPAAEAKGRDRVLTIIEAVLLAVVAVLAAWSGFASAKWSTGNKNAMRVAEQRFRTPFLVAFDAWLKTNPFTNPNAPKGPTYMPQYVQPELAQSNLFDARADNYYALGEVAGSNADGYVRTTVYLASVLFLVGISGHFRVRGARRGLVTVGGVILAVSVVLLILAPRPPV